MTEEFILGAGLLKLPGIDLEEIQSTKRTKIKRRHSESLAKGG